VSSRRSARFSLGLLCLDLLSFDTWAIFAAIAFIVLVVAGFLPRIPW
jgi:hypothetical protein